MTTASPLSLMVINDVQLVVDGLVAMLDAFPDRVNIVSAQIGTVEPVEAEIALVDAFGHPNAGVERVAEIIELGTVERVILYTWKLTPAQAVEAIAVGASGILSKSASSHDLVRDIARVADGELLVNDFPFHVHTPTWLESLDTDLSARELELLAHVANGLNNVEIAGAMYLAQSSVKTYLKRVYRKLGINSRAQAVMRAVELGLAGPDAGPNVGVLTKGSAVLPDIGSASATSS